jgi:hypothetical protein
MSCHGRLGGRRLILFVRRRPALFISAFVVYFVPILAAAAIPGVETFDAGTNGWIRNTTSSTVVHVAAGGNPGGFIETRKDLTPPVFDVGAMTPNPNFTGDYAAAGIMQASVDVNFMTNNITGAWLRYRTDAVTNGWLFPLTNAFPTDVWNTYTVNFNPTWTDIQARNAGWLTDDDLDPGTDPSPTFASVLASVGTAEVRIGSMPTSTLAGIDNYAIAIPEPRALVLAIAGCLAGLMLWYRAATKNGSNA